MTNKTWHIRSAQVLPLRAPLIQPFRTALGEHKTLDNLLFVLTLADGTKGYGEAAVASHISGETISTTRHHLQAAARQLVGCDAHDYAKILRIVHARWRDNPAAIAAIETALFDALARKLGCPLWRLFGTRCRKLQTDITIVIADLSETEDSVRRFYHQGFRRFKVKIGRDFDLDIRRIEAVHKLAPKSVIYLDANQGFSAAVMLKFLAVLKHLRIRPALLEQPVPRTDLEGLKKIFRSTDIPVCADESVRSLSEAVAIIRAKAANVMSIKLMKFGIIEAVAVAKVARAAGLKLMMSGMMESSLAMTASAHLAAGMGGFAYIDLDTPFFIRGRLGPAPYLSARGVYDLRGIRRGIGITPKITENKV